MINNKPSIIICHDQNFNDSRVLNNIIWGIEEEGIPYQIKTMNFNNAFKMGHDAARDSILEIGIGIGSDGKIVLHHAKLDEERPLFISGLKDKSSILRMLGANAARLVKRIPLKIDIEEYPVSSVKSAEYLDESDIKGIVSEVLKRILKN